METTIETTSSLGFVRTLYAAAAGQTVRYGDAIRLVHVATGAALHSHAINYAHVGGSGQQQVTGYPSPGNSDDIWLMRGPHGTPLDHNVGQAIRNGDFIRLFHCNTGRNLHSHDARSPVTGQQEVTAFGEGGGGDANDNWQVEMWFGDLWRRRLKLRLIHVNTRAALHSHSGQTHPQHTSGQQEVTGFASRDINDWWRVSHRV